VRGESGSWCTGLMNSEGRIRVLGGLVSGTVRGESGSWCTGLMNSEGRIRVLGGLAQVRYMEGSACRFGRHKHVEIKSEG
jgi:hypothetical protein